MSLTGDPALILRVFSPLTFEFQRSLAQTKVGTTSAKAGHDGLRFPLTLTGSSNCQPSLGTVLLSHHLQSSPSHKYLMRCHHFLSLYMRHK